MHRQNAQSMPVRVGIVLAAIAIGGIWITSCGKGGSSDKTPPAISNPQPSGQLSAGTTFVMLSIVTNEAATCRYYETDVSYSGMANVFATTGSTSHSTAISGLANNTGYTRYVRCMDKKGNANGSSTVINWSVGGVTDATPPVVSNPLPSGEQTAGTTAVYMQVTTDEPATCRYSIAAETAYSAMANTFGATGGTSHSTQIARLANGRTYVYYIRCQDASGNTNSSDTAVIWSIAIYPGSATIEWDASLVDADHSDPDGYKIYRCGPASGTCANFSYLAATTQPTYTAKDLATGAYCFQITAYNYAGESPPATCGGGNCCKTIP
jgi:hypothetical protein